MQILHDVELLNNLNFLLLENVFNFFFWYNLFSIFMVEKNSFKLYVKIVFYLHFLVFGSIR